MTYTVLAGSATQGPDYGGTYTGVLPFAANQTSQTFKVTIVNDTLAEGPETCLLQLSSPTGGAILGPRPDGGPHDRRQRRGRRVQVQRVQLQRERG